MRREARAVIASLALAMAGHTASIVAVTEDELIDAAQLIVRGVVTSSETAIIRGRVVTESTLEVSESLKGDPGGPVVHVITAGGDLQGQRLHIPGAPGFAVGEEVCVFLEKNSLGWILTGISQGKYRLEQDSSTGLTVARRSQAGLRLARPTTGQTRRQALQAATPDVSDWGSFRRRILDRVGGR